MAVVKGSGWEDGENGEVGWGASLRSSSGGYFWRGKEAVTRYVSL